MNICVFCGSSIGSVSEYADATRELGACLAKSNSTLVYGGAHVGLMGVLADEVLRHKGNVIGVIPEFLMQRELGHRGLNQLIVADSMHERKKKMADLADAFIALPGGWGTLDELAEILTWKQLGLVTQPVGILNVNSFYDSLHQQMEKMASEGFLDSNYLAEVKISENPAKLLTLLGVKY